MRHSVDVFICQSIITNATCVMQHFPMYRVSDGVCIGVDAASADVRDVRLRQRWDCLSKEASDEVLSLLTCCISKSVTDVSFHSDLTFTFTQITEANVQ